MKIHCLSVALCALALAASTGLVPAAIYTVTTTADSGSGSLRQAIVSANNNPGLNTIRFNIPGTGAQTVAPATAFPDILNPVTIDGYSQPGSSANTLTNGNNAVLLIRLDGITLSNSFSPALKINGVSGCTVRGLAIVRFYTGIQLYAASGNTIAGNWLGVDLDNMARGGTGIGVDVTCAVFNRSTANVIGGWTPADRNVVGGFHTGLSFFPGTADHNTVVGNYIGLDSTGSLPRGNVFEGIKVQAAGGIQIGGTSTGAGNVIGGNQTGVSLLSSLGTVIQGNIIGADPTRHYGLGNSQDGITAQSCTNLLIGGTNAGNVIANSTQNGITLQSCSAATIQGNWIGTDLTGAWAMGNGAAGINSQSSYASQIGGTASGTGNTIEFNTGAGVSVAYGQTQTVSGNAIYDNGGPGISLGSGANGSAVSPGLTNVVTGYGSTTVQGFLSSLASTSFRLEFFATPTWDSLGVPEGRIYLGGTSVATDVNGSAAFSANLSAATPTNMVVTATATDAAGNTSPFSAGAMPLYGPQGVSVSVLAVPGGEIITWPSAAGAGGFSLQATTLLSPPSWHYVTGGVSDNGVTRAYTVTNGAAPASQYFRLAK